MDVLPGGTSAEALEPTISELLTVTRGHAIFHTKIDNRQSTEMIYVTDTVNVLPCTRRPFAPPPRHPPEVYFLLVRSHTRSPVHCSPRCNPLRLTWRVEKSATSKNCIATTKSSSEFNVYTSRGNKIKRRSRKSNLQNYYFGCEFAGGERDPARGGRY